MNGGAPDRWGLLSGRAQLHATVRAGQTVSVAVERRTQGGVVVAKPVRLAAPRGWAHSDVRKVSIVLPTDDSGSMYAPWGDPTGVRRAAALSVVDLMRRGGGGRVGVVHWGSIAPAELSFALTPVRNRRVIDRALQIPSVSLGGNNFPAALARSHELLTAAPHSSIQLVVAITDGVEDVGTDTAAQIALLPAGCVHVVLVDHSGGCGPDLESAWRALDLGSFTRLDVLHTQRMAWQIADIVAHAAGTAMPPLPHRARP